ncbi:BREX system ATP-binding domain-containing protein [Georgenia sp. AZ-5]|uniref:BREX system ATP-binding domain-containing protein n=1 Tax=Georgenia sp. AZ-5 TaxID=3367526 RepID=UPI003754C1F8
MHATPLVGRAADLSVVADVLDRAQAGHSAVLVLSGEPGIGKSRLAEEAAARALARNFGVLVARASPCTPTCTTGRSSPCCVPSSARGRPPSAPRCWRG